MPTLASDARAIRVRRRHRVHVETALRLSGLPVIRVTRRWQQPVYVLPPRTGLTEMRTHLRHLGVDPERAIYRAVPGTATVARLRTTDVPRQAEQ